MKSQKNVPAVTGEVSGLTAINQAVRSGLTLVITGILTMWGSTSVGQQVAPSLALLLFAYILSLQMFIDIRHGILPHPLNATLFVLGVALAPVLGQHGYMSALLGGAVAFFGLLACGLITQLLTGKESLGGGDLWLVMGLGAWVGIGGLPMFVVCTAFTGFVSIALKRWLTQGYPVLTENEANKFAFGPALCMAGWLAALYGDTYWQAIAMLTGSAG